MHNPQDEHMPPGDRRSVIIGVALLAACTLVGAVAGDALGTAVGVKANVGGVGIAMILLIAGRLWLLRRGLLSGGIRLGVELWGALYIPIVVAMAAQQNVAAAVRGGPLVIIVAIVTTALCFLCVALIGRAAGFRPSAGELLATDEVAE